MTGNFLLDWAILAVSLFNTIILIWLGLTVLLNAEKRVWGIWLAGGGLLTGGAFFISHTAILGHGGDLFSPGMDFWWHVGWAPVVALPYGWYAVMLWYSGFWEKSPVPENPRFPGSAIRSQRGGIHRQRVWFGLITIGTAVIFGMLVLANPLPSFSQLASYDLAATPSVGGIPLLILIFPIYIILCMALSLDALRRPGPSARAMGEAARQRARPWLFAASVTLLAVCLLVSGAMVWIILNVTRGVFEGQTVVTIGLLDLTIAGLIGMAVILLGQAVVAYEIFTGKTLPRRGLARGWQRAVILAAGTSVVVGWSLTIHLRTIYGLLLAVLLMTTFYALLSWRLFAERERLIQSLRPFVTSQGLYDRLMAATPVEADVERPFRALCADVLGARRARLVAIGPLAPLVGDELEYPAKRATSPHDLSRRERESLPPINSITAQFTDPKTMLTPLEPSQYDGFAWATPLWSERGLIGVLLLGEKRDGGPFAQEEIEIAQAVGERLLDVQAGAEMARRLMVLQRQRLAQSQVDDRRTRRSLHDDVLPRLHAAMLSLSGVAGQPAAVTEAIETLGEAHRRIADLLHDLPAVAAPEVARLGLAGALRRVADEELRGAFDTVIWEAEAEAEQQAQNIPPLEAEVLFYAAREAMRNAARHARHAGSERPLNLRIEIRLIHRSGSRKEIEVIIEDNGVGLTPERNSHSISGQGIAGQGIALHSTLLAVVGGTLAVDSAPNEFTRVTLSLPLTAES